MAGSNTSGSFEPSTSGRRLTKLSPSALIDLRLIAPIFFKELRPPVSFMLLLLLFLLDWLLDWSLGLLGWPPRRVRRPGGAAGDWLASSSAGPRPALAAPAPAAARASCSEQRPD